MALRIISLTGKTVDPAVKPRDDVLIRGQACAGLDPVPRDDVLIRGQACAGLDPVPRDDVLIRGQACAVASLSLASVVPRLDRGIHFQTEIMLVPDSIRYRGTTFFRDNKRKT